jgi:ParB family chromosome partitioning protein
MDREVIEYVPVDRLASNPQVRKHFDDRSLTGLAISLQQEGMQHAIRARRDGDNLIIISGERRWRAAIKAGLKEVPVIIVEGPQGDAAILCAQIVENIQRCDLLPIEKAEAYDRLIKLNNWTEAQVGQRVGCSGPTVCKHLKLLTLPEDIKAELRQGKIPLRIGYELSSEADPVKQSQLAAKAAAGQLTCNGAKAAKRQRREPAEPKAKQPTYRAKAPLVEGKNLSLCCPQVRMIEFVSCLKVLLSLAEQAERDGIEVPEFFNRLNSRQNG